MKTTLHLMLGISFVAFASLSVGVANAQSSSPSDVRSVLTQELVARATPITSGEFAQILKMENLLKNFPNKDAVDMVTVRRLMDQTIVANSPNKVFTLGIQLQKAVQAFPEYAQELTRQAVLAAGTNLSDADLTLIMSAGTYANINAYNYSIPVRNGAILALGSDQAKRVNDIAVAIANHAADNVLNPVCLGGLFGLVEIGQLFPATHGALTFWDFVSVAEPRSPRPVSSSN